MNEGDIASSAKEASAVQRQRRRSDWTCRLPVEIMTRILSHLADGHHAATLAALQKTSSVMYWMVTSLLYKDLRLDIGGLRSLLRLLNDIPNEPEVFDQTVSVTDCGPHPLDLHRYYRLRWALSHVRSITLTIDRHDQSSSHEFEDYVYMSEALRNFNGKTLWPALKEVHIRAKIDSDYVQATSINQSQLETSVINESGTLCAFGLTIRPIHLRVDLPDRPASHLSVETDTVETDMDQYSLWRMTADHVTVTNVTHELQGIPRGTKSLTIDFGEDFGQPNKDDTEFIILNRKVSIFGGVAGISNLTVIGFERGLDTMPIKEIHRAFQRVLAFLKKRRSQKRRWQNFRYRVRPWRSNAGSKEMGDWHTIDDQCRKE
jgi:hypothetical protein